MLPNAIVALEFKQTIGASEARFPALSRGPGGPRE
jgi:hypothetical protein